LPIISSSPIFYIEKGSTHNVEKNPLTFYKTKFNQSNTFNHVESIVSWEDIRL